MRRLPALLVLSHFATAAYAQTVVRPVAYPPASIAWGVCLRHFFESDFGKAATLPRALEPLRTLDLAALEGRRVAGPFALALAQRGVTPGGFVGLGSGGMLTELTEAAGVVERGELPSPEALARKLEATAKALGAPIEDAPYLRVRRAADGRETARLAGEFASGLRWTGDDEKVREYVNALWEVSSAPPSRRAHRVAARALAAELGWRRSRTEKQKLLALRAMRALGDRTPYEDVERSLVQAALDESGTSMRDRVSREADLVAGSIATLSPFRGVRRSAARSYREAARWAADEERRRELETLAARLEALPPADYWPAWKPARPPGWWSSLLALVGLRLVK